MHAAPRWFLLFALASACAPQLGHAQRPGTPREQVRAIAPGTQVRIVHTASGLGVGRGALVGIIGDTVIVATDSSAAGKYVLDADWHLQQHSGTRSRLLAGMGIGVVIGAIAGGLYGATQYEKLQCRQGEPLCFDFGPVPEVMLYGAIAAGGAGLVGATIGYHVRYDAWRRVDRPRVALNVTPASRESVRFTATLKMPAMSPARGSGSR
jgi:hypothetical protein